MTFDTSVAVLEDGLSAFNGFDIEEAYEDEVTENKRLNEIIDALTCTDSDKEIVKLSNQVKALQGRLQQALTSESEAIKQAKYYAKLLTSIRKKLGVENNTEILITLKNGNRT